MPSNILTTDTSFPKLTKEQSVDEKFGIITNYLYMLMEQLRYSMANLGRGNINDAEFDKIADVITEPLYVKIEDAEGNTTSLKITVEGLTTRVSDAEGNISNLTQTADSLTTRVSDAEGNISNLTQTADSLTATVGDLGGSFTTLQTPVNGVTVTDEGGTTWIKGSSIETESLYVDAAHIEGTLTASVLEGETVSLLNGAGKQSGSLIMTPASSSAFATELHSDGALRLSAGNGAVYISNWMSESIQQYIQLDITEVYVSGEGQYAYPTAIFGFSHIAPNSDIYSCGLPPAQHRWNTVYVASGTITTSDRNRKTGISYDMDRYDALFDGLRPTPYRYLDGSSGRTHIGMIAQDVEEALARVGLTSMDFAGFIKSPNNVGSDGINAGEDAPEDYIYSLRYDEFIGLCIDQIQRLKTRVTRLEDMAG